MISTGDILSTVSYPVFDVAKGGSINGIIDGLNDLLDLVIAEYQTEGGTLLIPGHGRVCDAADLATYRDAVTIIRDRVQDMIKRGMTLAQVKAARPTKDYDPRYDVADLDEGSVRRGGLSQSLAEEVVPCSIESSAWVLVGVGILIAGGRSSPAGRTRRRAWRQSAGRRARECARPTPVRSDRLLGLPRLRRVALPHAHAAERQRRLRAVNAEGRRVAQEWDPAKDEAAGDRAKAMARSG